MKKILIIMEEFAPLNIVGAIRLTKLAKILNQRDYDVTVIAGPENTDHHLNDSLLIEDLKSIKKIHRIPKSEISIKKINNIPKISRENRKSKKNEACSLENNKIGFRRQTFRFIINILDIKNSNNWSKKVEKFMEENLTTEKYDVVITSFSPLSSLITGLYVKKKYNPIWISDFRNAMDNVNITNSISVYILKKMQKNFINNSDFVTTLSTGLGEHLDVESNKKNTNKIKIIGNGFDEGEIKYLSKDNIYMDKSKVNIVYSGSVYIGRTNLLPIFSLLSIFIEKRLINKESIVFHYLGSTEQLFLEQAGDLRDIVKLHGMVDRKTSLEIQSFSDLIVGATWESTGSVNKGVIPIKIYEALLLKKPLVLIVSGDSKKQSEAAKIIKSCNAGAIFEEYNNDYSFVESLLLNIINEKRKGKEFFLNYNKTERSKYEWNFVVSEFEKLF